MLDGIPKFDNNHFFGKTLLVRVEMLMMRKSMALCPFLRHCAPLFFCLFFPLFFVSFYEDDDDDVALSFSKACAPLWLDHLPTTALAQAPKNPMSTILLLALVWSWY